MGIVRRPWQRRKEIQKKIKKKALSDPVVIDPTGKVNDLQGEEGVVVKFVDGRYVKIKASDYVMKHRALDGLRLEGQGLGWR